MTNRKLGKFGNLGTLIPSFISQFLILAVGTKSANIENSDLKYLENNFRDFRGF